MTTTALSPFCSEQALQIDQAIYGTASAETTVWFLLEYTQPWTVKAVEDNTLPTAVQNFLGQQIDTIPQSRLVFIKKSSKRPKPLTFYVAISNEDQQTLYKWELASYSDLLTIDLTAVASGAAHFSDHICHDNLFLVCTNGKRDQCCAKFGLPIFNSMAERDPQNTWQCTHIGGHRYAPVVGVFPAGLYYRVVDTAAGDTLIEQTTKANILLDGYRGRTCYTGVAQAADYFLREQTKAFALNRFKLIAQQSDNNVHHVTFQDRSDHTQHTIELEQGTTEPLLSGCTLAKDKPQPTYRFINHISAS